MNIFSALSLLDLEEKITSAGFEKRAKEKHRADG